MSFNWKAETAQVRINELTYNRVTTEPWKALKTQKTQKTLKKPWNEKGPWKIPEKTLKI